MSELAVIRQERVGGEEHGAIAVVNDFGNHAVMQRRWIKKDRRPALKRQNDAGHETECVEERQRTEEFVLACEIEDRVDLVAI